MSALGARVEVHEVPVGTLWRLDDDEHHRFTFDPAWLADPRRPMLGQQLEDRRPRDLETSGLPCWFAHFLPQGAWARHLRRWAGLPDDASDLELLLSAVDLPGALSLTPVSGELLGRSRALAASPAPPGALRFTLAGAQWKLSVRRGERGLVVPVVGEEGEWIAKFHDPEHAGLPSTEHTTLEWARAAGLEVPAARLAGVDEFADLPPELPRGDGRVLLVRRFDRGEGGRIHFEELAQVADRVPGDVPGGQYTGTYEQLAALVGALCPEDAGRFLDRLVFTVLSGDGDAHWKNWGLVYPDRRKARLAPAYDLVPTVAYGDRTLALTLSGVDTFHEVGPRSFVAAGRLLGWEPAAVTERVASATDRIRAAFAEVRGGYRASLFANDDYSYPDDPPDGVAPACR